MAFFFKIRGGHACVFKEKGRVSDPKKKAVILMLDIVGGEDLR